MSNKKLSVVELFAGVGGFRLGLEGWNGKSSSSRYKRKLDSSYEVVWSNQWEPSTKSQHASDIYVSRWGGKDHSNDDISSVPIEKIPDHDVLVGGFPCQDYSVANSLNRSGGLVGKKGVLWWEILRIIKEKGQKKAPKYLILENVDRLLKSPAKQPGRDFAVMLSSLANLGYAVEWRVVNAAEYGMPQRRRRTFIVAYKMGTSAYKKCKVSESYLLSESVLSASFPCRMPTDFTSHVFSLSSDLLEVSDNFNRETKSKCFESAGVMKDFRVFTSRVISQHKGTRTVLEDIVIPLDEVPDNFLISENEIPRWKKVKAAKKIERIKPDGTPYYFSEGAMLFDSLDNPARTIITSEGGASPSRVKHIIVQDNHHRRLTPLELERCNMFPDNHTREASDGKRAFLMGNALVVGVVERIGINLAKLHENQ